MASNDLTLNDSPICDEEYTPTEGKSERKEQCAEEKPKAKRVNAKTAMPNKIVMGRTNADVASDTKLLGHDRRSGAMSVTGQLYETKLLTLILLRFINNRDSVEFYLGANISGAGALDDLCFKYKPPNSDRHVIVFLQAKHKVDPDKGKITTKLIKKNDSDFSVQNHFESYLMIRQKFTPKSNDIIFKGAYHDSLCYFVVYTPLKHDVGSTKPLEQNDTNSDVKDLIQTNRSGDIFQLDYKNVDFLYKNLQEKHMQQLGKMFLELILNRNRSVNMMDDEIIKTYHVVLAQNVIKVIDTDVEGVRKGKFRSEFFENKEKLITIFRDTMFEEAVSNKALTATTDNDVTLLKHVRDSPSVENISKVIGNVVCYNQKTNQLELLDEKSKDRNVFEFLKQMKVEPSIVTNAVNVKGQEILQHLEFNLPAGFGNRDLILKGNAKKIDKRLDFLAVRMARLFESAQCSNGLKFVDVHEGLVGPDGVVERGVVEHNGGMGSALGNLLVLDRDTDALKFNSSEPLPELANKLWSILKANHDEEELTTYRFKFRIDSFPKAYLEEYWYEEYLVKDFIGQYWLCTGQAKEDAVESIAKKEVNKYVKAQGNQPTFRATTDAIFLILHDIIQKWWMLPDKAEYLTEDTKYLQSAMAEIVDHPLLSVLNVMCLMKLKSNGIEFNEAAVKSLGLDKMPCNFMLIVTDSVTHTALKLKQHYTHLQNCTFFDFNYVTNVMFCHFQDLMQEVKNCDLETVIITCESSDEVENVSEVLIQLVVDLKKNIIGIVDTQMSIILKRELTSYHEVKDTLNSLNNLSSKSQEKILNKCKVVFQGEVVCLNSIIDKDSAHLITSHTLQKLVNNETIVIGKPIASPNYNKIKEFYVDRNVVHDSNFIDENGPKHEVLVLAMDVFVVTAPPGMGKSTVLTYMSLETKKMYPDVWIARINLLSHSKQFHQWQRDKTVIDNSEALAFLCKAVSYGDVEYEFINTNRRTVLKRDSLNEIDLLQADLFIDSYKNGKTIIIFDGFDEIFPLYQEPVIKLMKVIENIHACDDRITKPKLWIASRSYNAVKHVLVREFGILYRLIPLTKMEHKIYLDKLWRKNMKLDKFTNEQLMNVNSFIDYMKQFWYVPGSKTINVKTTLIALFEMYFDAVNYFLNEIQNIHLSKKEVFKNNCNLDMAVTPSFTLKGADPSRLNADFSYVWRTCHMAGSPLHTLIASEFFVNQIKYNLTKDSNKWDLEHNTFFIYDHYLETKLLKIRFEEKNRIDIYNPDNIGMYEREKKEFIDMHRMLAFYSTFLENSNVLMSERKLGDVRSMIDKIKYATEKTGVIDCIVDGVPRFVHLIFAEYFAVDYICDMLKMAFAQKHYDRQEIIWRFVLSPSFRERTLGFTNMFDNQLELNTHFKEILEDANTQQIVFDILMTQALVEDNDNSWRNFETIFFDILSRGLLYTSAFLLKCILKYLKSNDVDKLVSLLSCNQFLKSAVDNGFADVMLLALDFVRERNLDELDRVLRNNGLKYGPQLATVKNNQIISDLRDKNKY